MEVFQNGLVESSPRFVPDRPCIEPQKQGDVPNWTPMSFYKFFFVDVWRFLTHTLRESVSPVSRILIAAHWKKLGLTFYLNFLCAISVSLQGIFFAYFWWRMSRNQNWFLIILCFSSNKKFYWNTTFYKVKKNMPRYACQLNFYAGPKITLQNKQLN